MAPRGRNCPTSDPKKMRFMRLVRAGNCQKVREFVLSGAVAADATDDHGFTGLIGAAVNGDVDMAETLLELGCPLEARNDTDNTALTVAGKHNHLQMVRFLLSKGADPATTIDGIPIVLLCAGNKNQLGILKTLVDAGADKNAKLHELDGAPLISVAASLGYAKAVEYLLSKGSDPHLEDDRGRTPVFYAIPSKKEGYGAEAREIVAMLAKAGADLNEAFLCFGGMEGRVDVMLHLLELGADPNYADEEGRNVPCAAIANDRPRVIRALKGSGCDLDKVYDEFPPIVPMAGEGHKECVKALLFAGARVDAVGPDKRTALSVAASMGKLDMCEILVGAGADVNRRCPERTPLYYAAIHDHTAIVKYLLSAGADASLTMGDDFTVLGHCAHDEDVGVETLRLLVAAHPSADNLNMALGCAIDKGRLEVAEMLIDAGASVNGVIKDGESALLIATKKRHLDIVRMLVRRGADVNGEIRVGGRAVTALVLFATLGEEDMVDLLVELGADVNLLHPLHGACASGRLSIVCKLMARGASAEAIDDDGYNALDVAEELERDDVMAFLERRAREIRL